MDKVDSPEHQGLAFVGDRTLTFGQVRRQSAAFAQFFDNAGLSAGDVIALITADSAGFYACFSACFDHGLPVAVIDPGAGTGEITFMIRKACPKAIIADRYVLERLEATVPEAMPKLMWRIDELLATGEAEPIEKPDLPDSAAYIMFTSGTTSEPKAVVVSRSGLQHHIATLSRVFGYSPGTRLLHYLPTHHTDGLVHGVVASLQTGMTVVHPGSFDLSTDLYMALRGHQISHFLAVPTMLAIIRRIYDSNNELFRYSAFRHLISTAGYLDETFWREFQEFFGVRISNFYGLTETISGSLYCGPDDDTFCVGTLGKPVDADTRIVDADGAAIPAGGIGELHLSGPHLMTGYLDDAKATNATIKNGWLATGDLFHKDSSGFFHFVGRKKDIINRGGTTIYPADIRKVLVNMPGVVDVEVIGVPDAIFEELIVVCAVVADTICVDDIREKCVQELAPERRPDRIELLDELPRGRSGKVQRHALVRMIDAAQVRLPRKHNSLDDHITALAADVFQTDEELLDASASPDTIENWDSYSGMEFVLAIERELGVRLDSTEIMQITNIGDAIQIVSAAAKKGLSPKRT